MPRMNHRWRNIIILTILIYVLYTYFPSPPEWENNRSADRPTPAHEQRAEPDFLYHSHFRDDPDLRFEDDLEQALVKIESSALPAARGPVKKIWQTGLEDANERAQDCKIWEEYNLGWEYMVSSKTDLCC